MRFKPSSDEGLTTEGLMHTEKPDPGHRQGGSPEISALEREHLVPLQALSNSRELCLPEAALAPKDEKRTDLSFAVACPDFGCPRLYTHEA